MAFDRETGKLLWQSGTVFKSEEKTHPSNPYCSASPVTDGERIIAGFGSAGVYCFDFNGKGRIDLEDVVQLFLSFLP